MKSKLGFIGMLIMLCIPYLADAQEYKSFTIENIASDAVWPAVFKAFQEQKFPRPLVNKNTGAGETTYYYYTAMMIKNRVRFKAEYMNGTLTVSIFGRQYMSEKGWADNLMPMSKKQASTLLDPLKDRIAELIKDKPFKENLAVIKTEQTTAVMETSKPGIYEDFVILRTGDTAMDLLAVYKNGNIISYDLWDDKKTVKALVFRENIDSEAISILFDEQEFPIAMVTDHIIVNIIPIGGNKAELEVFDLQGKVIGNNKIELPENSKTTIEFQEDIDSHGPLNHNTFVFVKKDGFPYSLINTSTITRAIACGTAVAAGSAAAAGSAGLAGPIVVVGVIAACESLYFDVVSKYVGEDHFMFDELTLASEVSDLVAAAALFNFTGIGLTGKIFTSSSRLISLITSNINSVDRAKRLYNKYKTPEITIEGFNTVISGSFGEWGDKYIVLIAESNFDNIPIVWSAPDSLWAIPVTMGDPDYSPNHSSIIKLIAQEAKLKDQYVTATQIINGNEITARKEIVIQRPIYFYLENCEKFIFSKTQTQMCEKAITQCKLKMKENGYIYFIVNKNAEIVESNVELNESRLNFIRNHSSDNHGFKSFVIESPCSFNCEGLSDKETIISLAHEATDKIMANEDKIKKLQDEATLIFSSSKNANNPRISEIASEIKNLEAMQEKIREEYGGKINKIAEKRTITFETVKSDKAPYYSNPSFRVIGAHWSNKWLTILWSINFTPHQSIYEDEFLGEKRRYYQNVNEFNCDLIDQDGKQLSKITIPTFGFNRSGINFDKFEKLEKVNIRSSVCNLTRIE